MKFGFLILLLGLAACETAYVHSETPRSIALCYDPYLEHAQDMANQAQAHCQRQGMDAVEASGGRCAGGLIRVVYECVP